MKILLIGYGKMGKAIEQIALERGHSISGIVGETDNIEAVEKGTHDVAIEFTQPASAVNNIITCFKKKLPVVSGTTGWVSKMNRVSDVCEQEQGTFFYASNFSLGVNLFFMLNEHFAELMGRFGSEYQVSIDETHHTEKRDSPSGTAISIAEGIISHHKGLNTWQEAAQKAEHTGEIIPIQSFREEKVPGTHVVKYQSEIDTIELNTRHIAERALPLAQ